MAKKSEYKKLVKMAEELNEEELTKEEIEIPDEEDFDTLWNDFLAAMVEINEKDELDEVPEKVFKYYEEKVAELKAAAGTGAGAGQSEADLKDMKKKEVKKIAKGMGVDVKDMSKKELIAAIMEKQAAAPAAAGGVDLSALEDELGDMKKKELAEKAKEFGVDTSDMKKKEIKAAILEAAKTQATCAVGAGAGVDLSGVIAKLDELIGLVKEIHSETV